VNAAADRGGYVKRSLIAVTLLFMLGAFANAEEPPSWLPLGNLGGYYEACKARDIVQVPDTSIIVACGQATVSNWRWPQLWRSTDQGANWAYVSSPGADGYGYELTQLVRDSATGKLWAAGEGWFRLALSTDNGASWSWDVTTPYPACAIEPVGNYLYFGGTASGPYHVCLYRLSQDSLQWEMVTELTQCNAITQLKYYDGKLLVFARDENGQQTRMFTYTPE
jgi:hypothetical protein